MESFRFSKKSFAFAGLTRPLTLFLCLGFLFCVPRPENVSITESSLFFRLFSKTSLNDPVSVSLKVKVLGLNNPGTLTVQNQDSETITISSNGEYSFPTQMTEFSNFTVSILTQPVTVPAQTCAITNPTGTISQNANLVEINCGTSFFPLNLNVFGIAVPSTGSLSIRNGAVDTLNVTADGAYTFSAQVPDQGSYSVRVLGSPAGHTCFVEAVPPPNGTVNNAAVTLNVNCLSVLSTNPPNQTALLDSDNIVVTFSKPVQAGSCALAAPTPAPPSTCNVDLQAAVGAINTVGNQVTLSPAVSWPGGSNQCIQLSGCLEDGTGRPFQISRPATFTVASPGNIKYVTPTGLNSVGACATIGTACNSITYAASQCIPGGVCSVLVTQGTYDVNAMFQRIQLTSGVQLIGGFNNTFTVRDPRTFTTTIRDRIPAGACGNTGIASSCSPIFNTVGLNTNFDIVIKGFTILTNPFNSNSAGILLDTINVGGNRILISENTILGSTSSGGYCFLCVNSGITAIGIPRVHILGNYILGGSGNSMSAGILLSNNTNAIITNNAISGGSHSGVSPNDASVGIWISNLVRSATQLVYITNNLIQSHHVIASPPVNAVNSYGVMALEVDSPDLVLAHNSIYGGDGTQRSVGIIQQANATLTDVTLVNNQISANGFATVQSYCINYDTTNAVGGNSVIRGNNFDGCTDVVRTSTGSFGLCAAEPAPLESVPGCATFLTNAGQTNFRHNPNYVTPSAPWNVFKPGTMSRCNSVFGGQTPPAVTGFLTQFDFSFAGRTINVAPDPVPVGSNGFSIGAYEFDGSCNP
ncbi:hypothetical protein EHQ12_04740 [Leptospira gomenensis]|uniref:Uncharacterized protein n=1 Tax=Leptospira gomenensis TaxID=2484974 RepID=A0A5F1YFD1_9LEPT|nr:hypothetical protein [Leptospira gomenensis]TGK38442.1 hypothetical protein EHQ17_02025 [Leptospira gomenensis]TGK42557.1 hypothetical protein EHQ07_14120 [Leptospira gomenensis]TGK42810.1 hypothetical protein EHQ12_04740 [Leptospira gomenensis]TGK55805.1 hypothetical protein EHQ13_16140 [Leptospira gomenensis]